MLSFAFKFVLLSTNKKGYATIYIQIISQRKIKRFTTDIKIQPKDWDKQKQRLKPRTFDFVNNNMILDKYEASIKKIIFDFQLNNKTLTIAIFENLFFKVPTQTNLIDYAKAFIIRHKERYSGETLRTYKTQINYLAAFDSNIEINNIDLNFIENYFNYQLQQGKQKNTAYKSTAFLKVMINQAIKENIIKENPFKYFKIRYAETKRPFLNIDEVKKIEAFYLINENEKLKKVCRYFLFSCYTGLRFSDIKALKNKQIVNNIIEVQMHKTKDFVSIPLSQKAKHLISNNDSIFVFNVMSNQKTNEYLKEIAEILQINKKLSFHVARHTFATLGIGFDIPIEVISKILGHKDLKTTQIYSKILDDVKLKHLNKFDNF